MQQPQSGESTSKNVKDQQAAQMIGLLMQQAPQEFYDQADRPYPYHPGLDDNEVFSSRLLHNITAHVASDRFNERFGKEPHGDARQLVRSAIYDLSPIVYGALSHHAHKLVLAEQISFIQHPRSMKALTKFARLPQSLLHFAANDGQAYEYADSASFGLSEWYAPNAVAGCPRAYGGPEGTASPIFLKTVAWTGELLVRAYNQHHVTT